MSKRISYFCLSLAAVLVTASGAAAEFLASDYSSFSASGQGNYKTTTTLSSDGTAYTFSTDQVTSDAIDIIVNEYFTTFLLDSKGKFVCRCTCGTDEDDLFTSEKPWKKENTTWEFDVESTVKDCKVLNNRKCEGYNKKDEKAKGDLLCTGEPVGVPKSISTEFSDRELY